MDSPLSPLQIAVVPAAALAVVAALGVPAIRLLRRAGAGQRVRDDGPQRHLGKAGTPTMGGMLIIFAAVAAATAGHWWASAGVSLELVTLVALTAAFSAIGAADDWMKITRGRSLGLRARHKLGLQLFAAAVFAYALAAHHSARAALGLADADPAGGLGMTIFWVLAIAATSNAVNLADGLDGLAAGLCLIAAVGFALLAISAGERAIALFALALAGACAGFLLFNLHPAKLFMGDVGSLALGAALAAIAAALRQPVGLLALCLVPFLEELSVIIQVIAFKTTGKRVFRMSPIHHHFELAGWPEQRVVFAFWFVAALAAALFIGISWIA